MIKGMDRLKLSCTGMKFTSDPEHGIVVCSGTFVCRPLCKRYHVHAVARIDDVDEFDEKTGLRLSRARCENKAYRRFCNDLCRIQDELVPHLSAISATIDYLWSSRIPRQARFIESFSK